MKPIKLCIIGKDRRMFYLNEYFKKEGYKTNYFSTIKEIDNNDFDAFIFSLETEDDEIKHFTESEHDHLLFVGNSKLTGDNIYDYFKDEVVTIENTIPTAEGVIATIIDETDHTLFCSNCLVVGYGKVSKTLSGYLGCLGSKVTIAARKESDRVLAAINGFNAIDICELEGKASGFDIIINTVPAKIINTDILKNIRNECTIIDLASKPGGVDFREAEARGKKVIWALGLPAKTAPRSAAFYIFKYINKIIRERYI